MDKTEKAYQQALMLHPNSAIGLNDYAQFLCVQKRYSDAQSILQRELYLPESPETMQLYIITSVSPLD